MGTVVPDTQGGRIELLSEVAKQVPRRGREGGRAWTKEWRRTGSLNSKADVRRRLRRKLGKCSQGPMEVQG